jgi:hypothetical protein
MFSVPPYLGVPLPALMPWVPEFAETPPDVPGDLPVVPPQAATVIARTARLATAREPRVRVRIDDVSS